MSHLLHPSHSRFQLLTFLQPAGQPPACPRESAALRVRFTYNCPTTPLVFPLLQSAFHFLQRSKNSPDTYFQRENYICNRKKYKIPPLPQRHTEFLLKHFLQLTQGTAARRDIDCTIQLLHCWF